MYIMRKYITRIIYHIYGHKYGDAVIKVILL